jgi:acid stress-induced BolA-like protein IbaG/YrbA
VGRKITGRDDIFRGVIAAAEIEKLLREGLPTEHVLVEDTTGGGDHFQAVVVSQAFAGKSRVAQHQLVYAALGDHMRARIHALALKTYTPEQWRDNAS